MYNERQTYLKPVSTLSLILEEMNLALSNCRLRSLFESRTSEVDKESSLTLFHNIETSGLRSFWISLYKRVQKRMRPGFHQNNLQSISCDSVKLPCFQRWLSWSCWKRRNWAHRIQLKGKLAECRCTLQHWEKLTTKLKILFTWVLGGTEVFPAFLRLPTPFSSLPSAVFQLF